MEPTYEELKHMITNVPATWLPALLIHVMSLVVVREVMMPGSIAALAAKLEEEAQRE